MDPQFVQFTFGVTFGGATNQKVATVVGKPAPSRGDVVTATVAWPMHRLTRLRVLLNRQRYVFTTESGNEVAGTIINDSPDAAELQLRELMAEAIPSGGTATVWRFCHPDDPDDVLDIQVDPDNERMHADVLLRRGDGQPFKSNIGLLELIQELKSIHASQARWTHNVDCDIAVASHIGLELTWLGMDYCFATLQALAAMYFRYRID